MAEHRTLEITLQYARDVQKVNLFSKMDIYAVVTIAGAGEKAKQKVKTPVDHDGNDNPTWNFPMKFTVDEAALQSNRLTLKVKLVCDRALGDRDVGEVSVPLKELLDSPPAKGGESAAEGRRFVSYQVRKPSGKPKGQLAFSYQFGEKVISAAAVAQPYVSAPPYPPPTQGKVHDSDPPVAYPAGPSSGYPPPPAGAYPPAGYPAPAAAGSGYSYAPPPPQPGYAYPPPPPGYGGYPPAQPGYGYPPPPPQQPPKKSKFGMGLGAGLLGGALGGLLIGDMIDGGGGCGGGCGGF